VSGRNFSVLVFAAALLAGCGSTQVVQPNPPAIPAAVARALAMTLAGDLRLPRRQARSWMLRSAAKKTTLIYSSDWTSGAVNVYEYPNGELVGSLSGFSEPYGGCVDANGDVFVTDIATGKALEYQHGGTSPINKYTPGGDPIGCSVDQKGDVAVTGFSPGDVTIYTGGNPGEAKVYSDADCSYMWPMGYDDKGNLIGLGDHSGVAICALLSGASSETTLTARNFSIVTPAGTMWDGKYIALADQTVDGSHDTGIVDATLSDTNLTSKREVTLGSNCDDYDDVTPFILGNKNTPVNSRQGKIVVGTNPLCSGSEAGISYWKYPAGGDPSSSFETSDYQHNVATVSIGK
jgi:hypothetical protein